MLRLLAVLVVLPLIFNCPPAKADKQQCDGAVYDLPAGKNILCSATWRFTGRCLGIDMWDKWQVGGRYEVQGPFVRPWLDYPTFIVGYELLKVETPRSWWRRLLQPRPRTDWWFQIGNAHVPDSMIGLGPGQVHTREIWPAGHGQPWPAQGADTLIDLHGVCFDDDVTILMTIYFTPL